METQKNLEKAEPENTKEEKQKPETAKKEEKQ